MEWFRNLGRGILDWLPGLLAAVLILVAAWLLATLVKFLVVKILRATRLAEKVNRLGVSGEKAANTTEYLGQLAFVIVFVLFLPMVFARLGLAGVAEPISGFVNSLVAFLPNLFAAALILYIGFFVARIIRDLVTPLLNRLGVDKLQQKTGAASAEATSFSTVLGYVVYAIVLIPIIIAALEVVKVTAISQPAIAMLTTVFDYIPRIITAVVIIGIGAFIAKLATNLLTQLLGSVGADAFCTRLLGDQNAAGRSFSLTRILAVIVHVLILLFFIVEALGTLQLDILTTIGAGIISYLPNVLAAVLILVVAWLLAGWLERLLRDNVKQGATLGLITRSAIMLLAAFMVLNQLRVATVIVNYGFLFVIAGAALAFALAFGLGGREFASRKLEQLDAKIAEVELEEKESED
ncbi:MAG: mechanosensitive ion channel [Bacillota bacterium]|nr:mechanosensitive ion channel [Bacillota bacterium]